jgi:hypothetical protein
MTLLDSINDKSWATMDWLWDRGLPIGSVFEKYNLPPVLFPLSIILIILLIALVFLPAGAPPCGDGTCSDSETCLDCPLDCGACQIDTSTGLVVTVELLGVVEQSVTVTLQDEHEQPVASEEDRTSIFEFTDLESKMMKAVVTCPNGKESSSRPRMMTTEDNIIPLFLPNACFDILIGVDNEPVETHGTVYVQIFDATTGESIDATANANRMSDDLLEQYADSMDGMSILNLRSGEFYYLTVTKSGYVTYNGEYDIIYLTPSESIYKNVNLEQLSPPGDGNLKVCVSSEDGPISTGRIAVKEVSGTELTSATLTSIDNGCITFSLDGGLLVKAALISPPRGCVASSFSEDVIIRANQQATVNLDISCNTEISFVKVILYNKEFQSMTDQSTITLWNAITGEQIPGTSPDSSLSMGSAGYTEEISIPAATLIQAKATSPSLEYINTVSGPAAFSPNEHGSIEIILGETGRGEFTFTGASIIYTPATPGSPVQVFIQEILYNGTVLTNENSEVKILVNGDEYDAQYVGNTL